MKPWSPFFIVAVLVLAVLSGCTAPSPTESDVFDEGNDQQATPPGYRWAPPIPLRAACAEEDDEGRHPQVVFETSHGTLVFDIYRDYVPTVADHFLGLVESGAYDGTRFPQVIQEEAIHGTASNSTADTSNEPGLRDEFHYLLRHDAPGTLSLWKEKTHGLDHRFAVAFKAQPEWDERQSMIGRLAEGNDTLQTIAQRAGTSDGEPAEEVVLEQARVVRPDDAPEEVEPRLGAWAPRGNTRLPLEGGTTGFLLTVTNCVGRIVEFHLDLDAPAEVTPKTDDRHSGIRLPAFQRTTLMLIMDVEEGAEFPVDMVVNLEAVDGDTLQIPLRIERNATVGQREAGSESTLLVNFALFTDDGRVVHSNYPEGTLRGGEPHFPGFRPVAQDRTYQFTPATEHREFLRIAAEGALMGVVTVSEVPPELAFAGEEGHLLEDRTLFLLFDVREVL